MVVEIRFYYVSLTLVVALKPLIYRATRIKGFEKGE
jgi:hypothetical protein